jgi:hypothetical protein
MIFLNHDWNPKSVNRVRKETAISADYVKGMDRIRMYQKE